MARHHANWIKAYLHYTRLLESPDQFHLWAAIATIAGALRGKCWFDMGHFRWTPNFFTIFVAPPGIISKSTSAGAGMRLLREVEDIKFGPNALTWQALIAALAESAVGYRIDGRSGPVGLDDKLQMFSCITIFASELGTLLDMQNAGLVDALTDLWDGSLSSDTWSRQTLGLGRITIENPWVNIIACTTPTWIATNVPKTAIGGGFISRCVFVYGDEKRRLSAYPKLESNRLGIDISREREALVEDLREIAGLLGEFRLTPEAEEFGTEWYEAHNRNPGRAAAFANDLSGYMARKQAHSHKLAMVISAARSNSMMIEREDLETALQFLEMSEAIMPKVFGDIHASVEMGKAQRILDVLREVPRCSRQALYRAFMREMNIVEFNGFVDSLLTAGEIGAVEEAGVMYLTAKKRKEEAK